MADAKTATKGHYYYALGRRKSATARVRLMNGKGNIVINDKPVAEYFAESKLFLGEVQKPFAALELALKDLSLIHI